MATRSRIGMWTEDRKIKSVYCHWDGYPSNNGTLLLENYNTKAKVEKLIALGEISSLKKTIKCPKGHTFETPKDDCTVFYGRDRGETDVEPLVSEKLEGMPSEEFDYLFDPKTKQWSYRSDGDGDWIELTPEDCKE